MSIENGSNENYNGIIKINNTHRIYIPQELIPYLYTASVSNESCWDQLINIINNKKVQKNTDIVLCGMPDIHIGYAFPIGTIVGMPLNKHTLISPMGVGNDINCGVRCLKTNLKYNDIKSKITVLAEKLYKFIPCGTERTCINLTHKDIKNILLNGIKGIIGKNFIIKKDNQEIILNSLYKNIEDYSSVENCGSLPSSIDNITQAQLGKGISMIGTLGAGNHYLEIQRVDEVFEPYSEFEIDDIIIFIHCGSRSLGSAISEAYCEKISDLFIDFYSENGQNYFESMNAAANYAFVNREFISMIINNVFKEEFADFQLKIITDTGHNIAKIEIIDGKEYLIHRKGASRSYPNEYIAVGGSMGTCSYILKGTSCKDTFYSTCHGSGRLVPRREAHKIFNYKTMMDSMKNIELKFSSKKKILEEAPNCYKDIEIVVNHCEKMGINKKIARTKPLIVIKG